VADLAAALRLTRYRWDFGKIYQVLENLGTNQFPEAIGVDGANLPWSRYSSDHTAYGFRETGWYQDSRAPGKSSQNPSVNA